MLNASCRFAVAGMPRRGGHRGIQRTGRGVNADEFAYIERDCQAFMDEIRKMQRKAKVISDQQHWGLGEDKDGLRSAKAVVSWNPPGGPGGRLPPGNPNSGVPAGPGDPNQPTTPGDPNQPTAPGGQPTDQQDPQDTTPGTQPTMPTGTSPAPTAPGGPATTTTAGFPAGPADLVQRRQ